MLAQEFAVPLPSSSPAVHLHAFLLYRSRRMRVLSVIWTTRVKFHMRRVTRDPIAHINSSDRLQGGQVSILSPSRRSILKPQLASTFFVAG